MRRIVNLEIHVAHSCNLACESCSHYSNHGHKGVIDLATAERWMAPWADRLRPAQFSLVGGEPTIHPDLEEFFAREEEPVCSMCPAERRPLALPNPLPAANATRRATESALANARAASEPNAVACHSHFPEPTVGR